VYIASILPGSPLVGIGFSLGAAVMTRYLGEQGDRCRIGAATVLCPPLNVKKMSRRLDSKHILPRIYSLTMARKMLRSFAPHLAANSSLSSSTSPLHHIVPDILGLADKYRWRLRASHVTDLVISRVGGSSPDFPFTNVELFLDWACPGNWIKRIKR
jgi:hypothetical protein